MTIILNGTTGITTPGITNQGVVEFTAGSVSAPSLTTTSDTNTGIYFPAADTIAFTEGGTESFRINSSGNAGLGTTTPTDTDGFGRVLDIQSTGGGQVAIRDSDDTTKFARLAFDGGTTNAAYVGAEGSGTSVLFRAGAATRATLDSSGNLGLGVTPSAFAGAGKNIQFGNGPASIGTQNSGDANFMHNAYESPAGTFKYVGSGIGALRYQLDINNNVHKWYYAASGTANNTISFTQAMTLDASGNLGINTTSPSTFGKVTIQVAGTTTPTSAANVGPSSINLYAAGNGGSTNATTGIFGWSAGSPGIGSGIGFSRESSADWGSQIRFYTHPTTTTNIGDITERARITSGGDFVLGIADSTYNSAKMEIHRTSAGDALMISSPSGTGNQNAIAWTDSRGDVVSARIYNVDDGAYGASIVFANRTGMGTTTTERARITTAGDFVVGAAAATSPSVTVYGSTKGVLWQNNDAATNGFEFVSYRRSNVQIGSVTQNGTTAVLFNTTSDARLKQNIMPAAEAGEKIDAIQIVSYDWKSAPDEHIEYGVIAQDLNIIAPQAVNIGDDGEEIKKTWGVDYSKLVPMLVKEMQSLRKRVAELESK